MQENKNLYDYTSEELKEKLLNDFEKQYSKYNYSKESWEEILIIKENFEENILQTSFPLALYNETKFKLAQVKTNNNGKTKADIIFDNVLSALTKVGKSIAFVYDSIKFVFSIFGLTAASVIITIFIHLILGTFIYAILPKSVTPLMVQSIISAVLFIIFKVLTFFDRDDKNVLNNYKLEVVKFSCTIPFYCCVFLIFTFLNRFPVLEELFPIFYPHMWLSSFTNEYVFSPMIGLTINCLISIIIYVVIRKKTEY